MREIPCAIHPGAAWLGHTAGLCRIYLKVQMGSTRAATSHSPTGSAWGLYMITLHQSIGFEGFMNPSCVKWSLQALVCMGPVSSIFEHFFIDSNLAYLRFITHPLTIFLIVDAATLLWIKSMVFLNGVF